MFYPKPSVILSMTTDEWQRFVALVLSYFTSQGKIAVIEDDSVMVEDDRKTLFGLGNLAATCSNLEAAKWPSIIAKHFQSNILIAQEREKIQQLTKTFSQVKDLLLLRLSDRTNFQSEEIYVQQYVEGVSTCVVFNMEHSITYLARHHTKTWGLSDNEIFAVARENLKKIPFQPTSIEDKDTVMAVYHFLEDFSSVAAVYLLPEHPEYIGKYGALVAIPTNNVCAIHPIQSILSLNIFFDLQPLVKQAFSSAPSRISPFLFWYYKGEFTRCGEFIPNKLADLLGEK